MKTFGKMLALLSVFLAMPLLAQSTITGVIPQYANGSIQILTGSVQGNAAIDGQGNFSFQVISNPNQHLLTFNPLPATPYSAFSLTITAGPGINNITSQLQQYIVQVGVNLGIKNQSVIGTDPNGNAIPGTSSGSGLNQLTGDVLAGPGTGSQTATLANTAVTPGSYTNPSLTVDAKGRVISASNGSAGTGTVTSFSAGTLSPLFTTSVATATSTPALTFALSSAAQNSVFAGPATGGAGAPSYQTAPTISAANMTSFPTFNQNTIGTAANLSGTPALPNGTTATTQTVGDNTAKLATDAFVLANAGGIGTVTHTAGPLTPLQLMVGNGSADSKVDTGCSTDGAGNQTCASYTSNGPGPSKMQLGTNIFSALPTCTSGIEGYIAPLTDSTTNTWGATITTGSGSDHVLAYCDGTNYTVMAK